MYATTEDLSAGLEGGRFTSSDLVNAYIARINEVNSTLHAVIEINPDALAIAKELDEERANGTVRGPVRYSAPCFTESPGLQYQIPCPV